LQNKMIRAGTLVGATGPDNVTGGQSRKVLKAYPC